MSFTRFHDDPERIKKQTQESSDVGRYWLNTPGQGVNIGFIEDAHIRLQGWGANLRNNTTELESDLKGITRKLKRDADGYDKYTPLSVFNPYPTNTTTYTDESRATLPAWLFRDKVQPRWDVLFHNPQENTEIPFLVNVDTKMEERLKYQRNNI
jgi:hypothetical protein